MNRFACLAAAAALFACGTAASPPSQTQTTSAPVPAPSVRPAPPLHPEDSAAPSELRSPPPIPAAPTRRMGDARDTRSP